MGLSIKSVAPSVKIAGAAGKACLKRQGPAAASASIASGKRIEGCPTSYASTNVVRVEVSALRALSGQAVDHAHRLAECR
jgi:hypothetical protein